jgi:hypothetical protein
MTHRTVPVDVPPIILLTSDNGYMFGRHDRLRPLWLSIPREKLRLESGEEPYTLRRTEGAEQERRRPMHANNQKLLAWIQNNWAQIERNVYYPRGDVPLSHETAGQPPSEDAIIFLALNELLRGAGHGDLLRLLDPGTDLQLRETSSELQCATYRAYARLVPE